MSQTVDAINRIAMLGKDKVFIQCENEKNQESTRTIMYHLKKKMLAKSEAELIGITKVSRNGKLFVKVYKRPSLDLYEEDGNGELVLIKLKKEEIPELKRIVKLMREEGRDEAEIQKYIDEYKESTEEPSSEFRGIDSKPEKVLDEKEEMKKMMEEEKGD